MASSSRPTCSEALVTSAWWSVPKRFATISASPSSDTSSSAKPIEKVCTGREDCSAISAVMRLESRPPLSMTPSGTSLIMRARTDSRSSSISCSCSSSHASASRGAPSSHGFQYGRWSTILPSSKTISAAGSSLRTPANSVYGPGTKPWARNSSAPIGSSSARTRPPASSALTSEANARPSGVWA